MEAVCVHNSHLDGGIRASIHELLDGSVDCNASPPFPPDAAVESSV